MSPEPTAGDVTQLLARLAFARTMHRDALNTYALVRAARIDLMGKRSTHSEQRAHWILEEQLARRRVREWESRLALLEGTARMLGVEP